MTDLSCCLETMRNTSLPLPRMLSADDYDYFMQGKKNYSMEELKKKVPAKYHSEIEVFVKQEADKLRPHGPRRVIQQPLARERSRTEREQCSSLK